MSQFSLQAFENGESRGTVLVIGAYGLIGAGIARHLRDRGMSVHALGRNARTAMRVLPWAQWHIQDLAALTTEASWASYLKGVGHVVNAAGILQDGAGERTDLVHHKAIAALARACAAQGAHLVQISAVGARADASTAFMRSKAAGDSAIQASMHDFHILRPGLVLAPGAFGGTALLRMLAAVPLVQCVALASAPIQTVGLIDVARTVELAIAGEIPKGAVIDLVEPEPQKLEQVVAAHRAWLGFAPPRWRARLPDAFLSPIAALADGLGRFGWRSPLRSTSIAVLRDGITGDDRAWRKSGSAPFAGMRETLAAMPARAEDRLAARMALLTPLILIALGLFWLLSGIIGLARFDRAAGLLISAGYDSDLARISVMFWSFVDIAIALALLFRRTARLACLAMIGVSLVYLIGATWLLPILWLDPLGPLLKVVPGLVLALVALVLLETR